MSINERSSKSDIRKERLLKLRELIKRKRPRFIRMNSWYLKRLPDSWRNPSRSLDNKIRLQKKGYPAKVKIGYRGPKRVRGLHPSGMIEVIVSNPKELEGLNPKMHAVRISSSVGTRKKREIVKKASELGIKILNAK
ncbi:MAG: 50S ribosomal protein L32e [Thermoprotei archaeon]|nr:MAG: 50S ribosomal protein L32e [Thermoprotei archaeon]